MLQPRQLCRQLLVCLHQIRHLRDQHRDLPILSGEPASLLTGEHQQLITRHLLQRRHPKIKLQAGPQSGNDTPSAARPAAAGHADAAARAASLTRQLSYPRCSPARTSSSPAAFSRPAAFSTTSRGSEVFFSRPDGVIYEIPDLGCPISSRNRAVDVAVTIAPNTSSASGSASTLIIARASLTTMHATIATTSISQPSAQRQPQIPRARPAAPQRAECLPCGRPCPMRSGICSSLQNGLLDRDEATGT